MALIDEIYCFPGQRVVFDRTSANDGTRVGPQPRGRSRRNGQHSGLTRTSIGAKAKKAEEKAFPGAQCRANRDLMSPLIPKYYPGMGWSECSRQQLKQLSGRIHILKCSKNGKLAQSQSNHSFSDASLQAFVHSLLPLSLMPSS